MIDRRKVVRKVTEETESTYKRNLSAYFEVLTDKKETEEVLAYIAQYPDYRKMEYGGYGPPSQ